MEAKLTREQANELLHKYVKGENYITHSYAVEAIMRGLAKKLAPEDVEYWGICGLLHDLDEETAPWRDDFGTHGPTSAKILRDEGFGDPVMENAIMSHNPACGKNPETQLEYALIAADPMSGFLKAIAQIYPDKKIGIVCEPINSKGILRVQLPNKKIYINHKRVKLHVKADQLYPEDYDFSIVFDTVEQRKARHEMSRKLTDKVLVYNEKE